MAALPPTVARAKSDETLRLIFALAIPLQMLDQAWNLPRHGPRPLARRALFHLQQTLVKQGPEKG
jgi:hypothetical protein